MAVACVDECCMNLNPSKWYFLFTLLRRRFDIWTFDANLLAVSPLTVNGGRINTEPQSRRGYEPKSSRIFPVSIVIDVWTHVHDRRVGSHIAVISYYMRSCRVGIDSDRASYTDSHSIPWHSDWQRILGLVR